MQNFFRTARLAVLLGALLFTASAVHAHESLGDIKDTVKESFKVRPGGTLYIDIDHGNVEVESTPDDAVRIEVERSVSASDRDDAKRVLERHDLTMRQRGNDVTIVSKFDRSEGWWGKVRGNLSVRIRVIVLVPERFNVEFDSGAGNVEVADLNGAVRGRTGAGNIEIGSVSGSVEISSGSGNIRIEGGSGLVATNTGAGNIELRDVRGEVRANTGAGNISAYITEQPGSNSQLTTGAGNVTVYLGDRIGVDVRAEASMGAASTDYPLKVEGKWMRKSFEGQVNGGGPGLQMRAGVGNVSLRRM